MTGLSITQLAEFGWKFFPCNGDNQDPDPGIGHKGKYAATSDQNLLRAWLEWFTESDWSLLLEEGVVVVQVSGNDWPSEEWQRESLANATAIALDQGGRTLYWFSVPEIFQESVSTVDFPECVKLLTATQAVQFTFENSPHLTWFEGKGLGCSPGSLSPAPRWLYQGPENKTVPVGEECVPSACSKALEGIEGLEIQDHSHGMILEESSNDPLADSREMEPLDVRAIFPKTMADFITNAAEAMQVDQAMLAMPVAAVMAASIGATRSLRLNQTWSEPACLWTICVAASGSNKSAPFRLALEPLVEINQELIDSYRREVEAYERERRRSRTQETGGSISHFSAVLDSTPKETRLLVKDITIEKLAEILEQNPHGMVLAADELRSWFQGFTRYSSSSSSEPYYLEFYDGSPSTVDRVTKPPIVLRKPLLSITGNCQPEIIAKLLSPEAWSSGLAPRFIICYPPAPFQMYRKPPDVIPGIAEYGQLVKAAYQRLTGSELELVLTPEAEELWIADLNARKKRLLALPEQSARRSQLAKVNSHPARWALIHHVYNSLDQAGVDGETAIGPESISAGIKFAGWVEREVGRVLGILTTSDEKSSEGFWLSALYRFRNGATPRDLFLSHKTRLKSVGAAHAILDSLAAKKLICRKESGTSPKGGRPTIRYFSLEDC